MAQVQDWLKGATLKISPVTGSITSAVSSRFPEIFKAVSSRLPEISSVASAPGVSAFTGKLSELRSSDVVQRLQQVLQQLPAAEKAAGASGREPTTDYILGDARRKLSDLFSRLQLSPGKVPQPKLDVTAAEPASAPDASAFTDSSQATEAIGSMSQPSAVAGRKLLTSAEAVSSAAEDADHSTSVLERIVELHPPGRVFYLQRSDEQATSNKGNSSRLPQILYTLIEAAAEQLPSRLILSEQILQLHRCRSYRAALLSTLK